MFIAMLNHADYRKTDFSAHAHRHHGRLAGCPLEVMKRTVSPTR